MDKRDGRLKDFLFRSDRLALVPDISSVHDYPESSRMSYSRKEL
jgi:hypothetical protein